jgi:formylglycine-generating enzyme required for sulfatase activity
VVGLRNSTMIPDTFYCLQKYAHRVGQKKANSWGFYDMHGNVLEWCRDIYAEQLPGGRDPDVTRDEKAPQSVNRVYRGGGWYTIAASHCSAYRRMYSPAPNGYIFGFRVALSSVR